jgi:hypothetical protein
MNAVPGQWRRLAVKLAQHACWVLPSAGSPWADAMRRELDYIADDPAALRWALGCIVASYRVRLTHRPNFCGRTAWRYVATSGVLMLLIGFALDENAGGQPAPPRPAFDESTCDVPSAPEIRARLRCGTVSVPRNYDNPDAGRFNGELSPCGARIAADFIDRPAQAPDISCADRIAPIPLLSKQRIP